MSIPSKAFILRCNENVILCIWSTSYYASLILEDLKEDHFEEIFGASISKNTEAMEAQYDQEYSWSFKEVDILLPKDAENKAIKIMKEAMRET